MSYSDPVAALISQLEELTKLGQYEQAFNLSEQSINSNPDIPELYFYAAYAAEAINKTEQAYQYQSKASQLAPENPVYHFNTAIYASNLDPVGLEGRAMLHYKRALELAPNYHAALWNYGEHLRLNGHIEMAIDCFNRILAMNVTYPKIYNRLAACYGSLCDEKNNIETFQKHILHDPTDVIGAWGYATSQLEFEHFDSGFEYYNKRFDCSWLNNAYSYPFDAPFWDGEFKPNMTLLIHGEQGLGDEMMFASTFNELFEQANAVQAKIIIGCKAPLARLFQTSFPLAQDVLIHSYTQPADISQHQVDAHIPMGNLLARFRKSHEDFAKHQDSYLVADEQRSQYYNAQIINLGRESADGKRRLRVGLMWGTVAAEKMVQRFAKSANKRSIPAELFIDFADLVDDIEFISLQNQDCGAEAARMPQLQVIDFSLDQLDFYDTAALISNLDLVITIDTSVYHLAAAMGLETWVTLIDHPEWRFGRKERTSSYWYKNTRYFKQHRAYSWSKVIEELHQALKERVAQRQLTQ